MDFAIPHALVVWRHGLRSQKARRQSDRLSPPFGTAWHRGIREPELVYSKDELLTAPPPTTKNKHQGKERLLASKHPLGTGHSQTIFCGCVCRAPLGVGKLGEAPLKRQVKPGRNPWSGDSANHLQIQHSLKTL